jgi:hypothetical protein
VSELAKKIAVAEVAQHATRRGPANACYPLYGPGDLEDWQAVENIRAQGHDWRSVQAHIDQAADVVKPLSLEKFRRHWRRRCFCWPEDLRL